MKTSTIEIEYNEINKRNGWMDAFQSIKEKSEQEAKERKYGVEESNKVNNRRLNRYRDVNPYDHSRIILHKGDTDYINANLIKMEKANRKYILTQGPLQNTIGHFWLMVWEQNSKAILMLNKLIEKKQVKCHMYWPEQKGSENKMLLPDVDLNVEYIKSEEFAHYTKRYFKLTHNETGKSREVIQFHYNTWPDFGIPSSPIAFLQFLKQVRNSGALNPDVGPAVVHCSAGIGRSGTFCLVDTCLVLVDAEGENKVSVQELLLELRRYRMGLIQTTDQLYFSYQAIIEGIKHFNKPEFNDYDEVPFISLYEGENDEAVPPSPPPRGASLTGASTHQPSRPVPFIPLSVSAFEFRDLKVLNNGGDDDDDDADKDETIASKRDSNTSENANSNTETIDRPLPPLPKDDSLEEIEESTSDEDKIEENDSDEMDEADDDDNDENIESNAVHKFAAHLNASNNKEVTEITADNSPLSLPKLDKLTANGVIASTSVSESDRMDPVELRRRKRIEKQLAMEEKIKEIKRKQKEMEEEEASAPKKRRSMMIKIAAGVGVVFGFICVYAYIKFV